MSYRAGIGPGLPFLGGPSDPTISCDGEDCDARIVFGALSPTWFLDRKPKPGWSLERTENADGSVTRIDMCPVHRAPRRKGK